jgi:TolB protein
MRSRTPVVVLVVVLAALLAAACSDGYDRLTTGTTTTTAARTSTTTAAPSTTSSTPPSTTTAPPGTTAAPAPTSSTTTIRGSAAGLPGRLAVVAFDGSLLTMRADGTDVRELAPGSPGTSVSAPAWTFDGSRLVWTALGTNAVRVRSAKPDGSDLREALLSPPGAAYLPAGTTGALAALRSTGTGTVQLDLLDPVSLTARTLRSGSPLFASWSPDGTRLLVHAGTDEVLVVRPDGTARPVPVRPGSFGTPQWLDDRTAVLAVSDAGSQVLSLVDVDTGSRRDLVAFSGAVRFQVAPGGAKLAYQVVPEAGGGGTGSNVSWRPDAGAPAAPQVAPPTTAPPTTTTLVQGRQNELVVIDLATRTPTVARDRAVNAFVWSPTGGRLAYLENDQNGAVRWRYWSAQGTLDGVAYAATRQFLTQIVPAFEQYSQSVRWWSPDGQAFTYAGRVGPRTGIWVQQMQPGLAANYVADGDSAIWSPR